MSHRVTSQTNITNKDLAIQALKTAGWGYAEQGSSIRITSGPMQHAVLNLQTGEVEGDSDWHNSGDNSLGALKKFYGEAEVEEEARIKGIDIEKREVLSNGAIKLTLHQVAALA